MCSDRREAYTTCSGLPADIYALRHLPPWVLLQFYTSSSRTMLALLDPRRVVARQSQLLEIFSPLIVCEDDELEMLENAWMSSPER